MAGISTDTQAEQRVPSGTWTEPEGMAVRGTLVVVPGRGERPALYERFGRRLAADAYRVHVVGDPTEDASAVGAQISGLLADAPGPRVLVGSDTGALFAAGLVASERLGSVDALVLAGLPSTGGTRDADWQEELEARTACPTHRTRLSGTDLDRGALYRPVPEGWSESADLSVITVPILGFHGADDPISPLASARARYASAQSADLVSIVGGRHDALNDQTHRTVAATLVLFLEQLRLGDGSAPIAVSEALEHAHE